MKTDQIQLRRILLVIETGRCYEYKGEYYEHLGQVNIHYPESRINKFQAGDRFVKIDGKESKQELVFNRIQSNLRHVKDPQKVMQEFGAIYQPTINTETAEKSGK